MKVIDKKRLDSLIDITREYLMLDCSPERASDILCERTAITNEWGEASFENPYDAIRICDIVYGAIALNKKITDLMIYSIFACLGYEVRDEEK